MRKGGHVPCPPMDPFARGQERKVQADTLRDLYPDYGQPRDKVGGNPHSWFVMRYNREFADGRGSKLE